MHPRAPAPCRILSLAGLALLCAACGQEPSEKQPPPLVRVRVVEVREGLAYRSLRYTAALRGSIEVKVYSQVPDRIRALNVEQGDRVAAGQVLAIISHDVLESGTEASLAGLSAARTNLDALRTERDRVVKMHAAKAVGDAQRDRIESQVLAAEASVRLQEAMLAQATTQRGKAFVRAPIAGVVGERFLEQGDMASPQLPILTLVQMEELKLEVRVPELELVDIERARERTLPVRVRVAGLVGADGARVPLPGRVVRVSPTIDPSSRLATVEVRLDNPGERLKPGMLAEVEMVVDEAADALLIPGYALLNEGAVGATGDAIQRVVYTLVGDVVHKVPVSVGMVLSETGVDDLELVQVVSGLKAGDRVVYRGQHLLKDGEQVQVVQPAKPGEPAPGGPAS